MAAIASAGSTDPEAVRKALASTKDFAGVTGRISFAGGGRIPVKTVTIMAVDDGQTKFEASTLPKQVPPP